MGKQLYLNLFQSKWIWYLGIFTILMNLLTALSFSDYRGSLMPFINIINGIAVVYTTSAYLNIHYMLKSDANHYFFFTLPNTKRNIIKGDYIYYMVMLALTAAIFGSYMTIIQETYYLYGFVMLIGMSLIVMSLYYLGSCKFEHPVQFRTPGQSLLIRLNLSIRINRMREVLSKTCCPHSSPF